ncbi:MAG: ATP-grasp domain-containing protein [Methylococcales bacterium]|nr:ATP-grasp domain-containing protein [Methylococcales bacterium]
MKILVFEYITGGGFNKQALPDTLASEGRLMVQALLANLLALEGVSIRLMLDSRLEGQIDTTAIEAFIIQSDQNCHAEFTRLIAGCDAVWPIAPEFDGILQALCETVEKSGKTLLSPPANAVAITGNKWATYQHLSHHGIATVASQLFNAQTWDEQLLPSLSGQWLAKPVDGVGCADSYILSDPDDFTKQATRPGQFIIQPHLLGKKTSLSCLFKHGVAWLVCVNLQQFIIVNQQYRLTNIIINIDTDLTAYQALADRIALALPELWGYVGIDLIETPEQTVVLEINPRLTTSFVGIHEALGINVAENVLQLLTGSPSLIAKYRHPITLTVQHYDSH